MGFPKLLQDLYENSGAGPKLKSSIVPSATNSLVGGVTLSDSAGTADASSGVAVTPKALKTVADAKADANTTVKLSGDQTIAGTKTFSASPKVPTAVKGTNSTVAASTAFVQTAIGDKANDADVVKLTGNQSIAGEKTFTSSPKVPTATAGDNTTKVATTAFVKTAIDNSVNSVKAVSYGAQTLTDAQKTQARTNIGTTSATDVQSAISNNAVKFTEAQSLTDAQKQQARSNIGLTENIFSTPIGSYIYFAGSSVPDHYLLCNGSAVSRTDYADLYAVIGDTYGAGDGSTTFNLPNLIDKFLEGSGTSGTEKTAGLPSIVGSVTIWSQWGNPNVTVGSGAMRATLSSVRLKPESTDQNDGYYSRHTSLSFDASRSSAIYGKSSTVQPPALTALPCIRYE